MYLGVCLLVSAVVLYMVFMRLLAFGFSGRSRHRLLTIGLLVALIITFGAAVCGNWSLLSRKSMNGANSQTRVHESTKAMIERMYGSDSEGLYIFTTGCEFLVAFEVSMLIILNLEQLKSFFKPRLTRITRKRGEE